MPPKRAWCPRCVTHLGPWRGMAYTAVLDGQGHAQTCGHPVEIWDSDGRVIERVYGEPPLPLWGPLGRSGSDQ
jgi:hypothetical protein